MLKFFKKVFNSAMDNEEDLDMIDILAFKCTNLMEKLSETDSENEKEEIIRKYVENADKEHQSISEFNDDLDWFNVTEPLTFSESLKGKIVVLDFFTYCCINCMHILPDLKKLEQIFSIEDGLVVIGVHSAKFENEKDSANILSAVQRYEISHPVVNDAKSSMWKELKIRCWPTMVILGPRGNPLFILMGEGHYDDLLRYIKISIDFYKKSNSIKKTSLPLNPAADLVISTKLKFPGKIASSKNNINSNSDNELFAISDSGNHRILVINFLGDVLQKIGGKKSGFVDGDFRTARFNAPQGVAFLNDNIIFVADTENHAIRKIDLKLKKVETVVGNGNQGNDRVGSKIGRNQLISSPWDVACHKTRDMDMSFHMDENSVPEKDIILIAMAGTHQIWALFLEDVIWWKFTKFPANSCSAIVGNGHEENRNNSYPQNAAFAQPSGLSISKNTQQLFIADSESSSIRKVSLADGKVMPVVGGDRNPLNLFSFGDIDGKQFEAKLQHPLGVSCNQMEDNIYVTDTYNHKIKKIDITKNSIVTCSIKDANGIIHQFNEPGGLCTNSKCDLLYVADTNNHSIEVVDLKTMIVKPLILNFLASEKIQLKEDFAIKIGNLKIKPKGGKIKLSMGIIIEKNIKLTEGAPQTWIIYLPNESYFIDKQNGSIRQDGKIDVDIAVPKNENKTAEECIKIYLKLNFCSDGTCFQRIYLIEIPLDFEENGLDCIIEDTNVFLSENSLRI